MLSFLMARLRRWRMQTVKPFGQLSSDTLRVSLCDLNSDVVEGLAIAFRDVAAVEVVAGNLLDLDCDAIVSPANSVGDMGGGIDKAIDDFNRGEAQRCLMAAIADQFFGELPVGMALVLQLPSSRFPFLVAAPTMRIAGSVAGSIHAYLAMRAALVAVVRHNAKSDRPIRSVAVPGLGTGVGGLAPIEAAEQMRAAHDSVIGGKWRQIVNAIQMPYALRKARLQ